MITSVNPDKPEDKDLFEAINTLGLKLGANHVLICSDPQLSCCSDERTGLVLLFVDEADLHAWHLRYTLNNDHQGETWAYPITQRPEVEAKKPVR